MKKMFEFEDFTLIENLTINFGIIAVSVIGLFFFLIKYPHKIEQFIAFVNSLFKSFIAICEHNYVKYDIQSTINSYIAKARKKAPQIETEKAKIEWVDISQTRENFMRNGRLIIRMQRSENQNRNLVNATMAFVSGGYLKKAKSYIAKYQREAIDLYICYDMLKSEKRELLDQFTQDYLKDAMTNEKIGNFFEKFMDINKAGIFYPIFIQELTFFGEKVFTKKRERGQIFEQIRNLVLFLYNFARREYDERIPTEFDGKYSKFAIRIVGKSFKINREGKKAYINNLKKLDDKLETLYLIGDKSNKSFIHEIGVECKSLINFDLLYKKEYASVIKDRQGKDKKVETVLLVLRSANIDTVHKS